MINTKEMKLWKTRLLKTCGVALIILTAMMKKRFAENPTNEIVVCGESSHNILLSDFQNRTAMNILCSRV
jgi:hypothetical protein